MTSSFYSNSDVQNLGFKSVGKNVQISKYAHFYNPEKISIGNDVRIDDSCHLSGKIAIGNNVHMSIGVLLFGGEAGIEIASFCGLSSRVAIYAESDDYSGNSLTNPTVQDANKIIISKPVIMKKHSIIGTGSTVLPGVTIGLGVSVGAMSLVTKNLDDWGIYTGIPCKWLKSRSKKILELEQKYNDSQFKENQSIKIV